MSELEKNQNEVNDALAAAVQEQDQGQEQNPEMDQNTVEENEAEQEITVEVSQENWDLAGEITKFRALNEDQRFDLAKMLEENKHDILIKYETSMGLQFNFANEMSSGKDRQMMTYCEILPESIRSYIEVGRNVNYANDMKEATIAMAKIIESAQRDRDLNYDVLSADIEEAMQNNARLMVPITVQNFNTIMKAPVQDEDKELILREMLGRKSLFVYQGCEPIFQIERPNAKSDKAIDVYDSNDIGGEYVHGRYATVKELIQLYNEKGTENIKEDAFNNRTLYSAVGAIAHSNMTKEQQREITHRLLSDIFDGKITSDEISFNTKDFRYNSTISREFSEVGKAKNSRSNLVKSVSAEVGNSQYKIFSAILSKLENGEITKQKDQFKEEVKIAGTNSSWYYYGSEQSKMDREIEQYQSFIEKKLESVPPYKLKNAVNRLVSMTMENNPEMSKKEATKKVYADLDLNNIQNKYKVSEFADRAEALVNTIVEMEKSPATYASKESLNAFINEARNVSEELEKIAGNTEALINSRHLGEYEELSTRIRQNATVISAFANATEIVAMKQFEPESQDETMKISQSEHEAMDAIHAYRNAIENGDFGNFDLDEIKNKYLEKINENIKEIDVQEETKD